VGAGEAGGLGAGVEAGRPVDEEDDDQREEAEEDDAAGQPPPPWAQSQHGEGGGEQGDRDE
jgi:hypothetical protein